MIGSSLSVRLLIARTYQLKKKLFFLRKYVGGPAKKAYLKDISLSQLRVRIMLPGMYSRTDLVIPLLLANHIVTRYTSWHKINPKDGEDLREFVDFLSSVESAMPYVQGLQVLNDCVENQRIAAKLPDWLSSGWNRTVTKYQDEHKMFPDFGYFIRFLSMEARIACNPITSLQAIKPTDQEKVKANTTRKSYISTKSQLQC